LYWLHFEMITLSIYVLKYIKVNFTYFFLTLKKNIAGNDSSHLNPRYTERQRSGGLQFEASLGKTHKTHLNQ
jgi:hypothetical protein